MAFFLKLEGLKLFNKETLQGLAKDLPSDLQGLAKSENELLKETIEALRQQLTVKDEQLAAKDKQLIDLTAALKSSQEQHKVLTDALTAAQALHAGTIQERLTVAQNQSEEGTVINNKEEPQKRGIFKRIFVKKGSSK